MADRRISTDTLTDIADAIRAKTGGSALITPQDMASEIESISSGGSLPSGITAITTGSFTLEEDVTSYTIQHGLDGFPRLFFLYIDGFSKDYRDTNLNKTIFFVGCSLNDDDSRSVLLARKYVLSSGNISQAAMTYSNGSWTSSSITVSGFTLSSQVVLSKSASAEPIQTPWRWIAIR